MINIYFGTDVTLALVWDNQRYAQLVFLLNIVGWVHKAGLCRVLVHKDEFKYFIHEQLKLEKS